MPQLVKQKTGMTDSTHDHDFEQLEQEFDQSHNAMKTMIDNLKEYRQSMINWLKHQKDLADDYSDNRNILETIISETEQDCNDTIDSMIMQQLHEYLLIMKTVAGRISKRNHKLLDYDRHKNTMKSLNINKNRTVSEEKNLIRAEEAFNVAQDEYEMQNSMLKEELPVLLDCQKSLLMPIYGELLKLQKRFFQRLVTFNGHLVPARTRPCQIMQDYEAAVASSYELLNECQMTRIGGLNGTNNLSKSLSSSSLSGQGTTSYSNKPLPIPNTLKTRGSIETIVGQMTKTTLANGYDKEKDEAGNKVVEAKRSVKDLANSIKSQLKSPEQAADCNMVIAQYDFAAQQAGDLSFKVGDKVLVLERSEYVNDWWRGRTEDGREGTFPGNYVK